ncbi:MAG: ABC transporter transmembrane domain-containing protein [Roseburia intestinalis]
MLDSLKFYHKRIKEGVLKDMWRETVWIYEYARKYWKQMIFYTLLGLSGTVISLISSLISRDMVDIITGKQAGLLVRTFCLYIGFSIGNMLISQVTSYFSNKISISVDNDIKADIFDKMLVTDLEAIQKYHTGDLLTRWNSDASNISNGILSWIPNLIIYTVRFISTFALVFYNDPMFALLAMLGMPVSMLMSRRILRRMKGNNEKSAAMNAKMSGFNQEAFSNIQTIKAFGYLVRLYRERLQRDCTKRISWYAPKLEFQKMSMAASTILLLDRRACGVIQLLWIWYLPRLEWCDLLRYDDDVFIIVRLTDRNAESACVTGTDGDFADHICWKADGYPWHAKRGLFGCRACVQEFYEEHKENGIHVFAFSKMSYTYHNGAKCFRRTL